MTHNNQYHISDLTASARPGDIQHGLEAVRDHLTRAAEDAEALKDALMDTYRCLSTDQRISEGGEATVIRFASSHPLKALLPGKG